MHLLSFYLQIVFSINNLVIVWLLFFCLVWPVCFWSHILPHNWLKLQNQTPIRIKWNLPSRNSLLFSHVSPLVQHTLYIWENRGSNSSKAWAQWTQTQLHGVTRCRVWSFSKGNNFGKMINVSGNSPRSNFWDYRYMFWMRTAENHLVGNLKRCSCMSTIGILILGETRPSPSLTNRTLT